MDKTKEVISSQFWKSQEQHPRWFWWTASGWNRCEKNFLHMKLMTNQTNILHLWTC